MPERAKNKSKAKSELTKLIRRTDRESPKPEDLECLRKTLDKDDLIVRVNESSEYAYKRVVESYTRSALMKELFRRQIDAKRKELNHESANAMVKMLIDQVILCQIRLCAFEAFHAEKCRESLPLQWLEYYDKTLSSYQRRLQRACESLAKVRRLLGEADLKDQQARIASQRLYKSLSY